MSEAAERRGHVQTKAAIITGAGSGIGRATAKQLFDLDFAIVGVARDAAKLT